MNQSRANEYPVPKTMKAWVLGASEELSLVEKPVPELGPAEVLVRIDAIAVCATDIEIIKHGLPALVDRAPRPDRRRVRDRRPHRRRGACRMRPLSALPRGHVHLVPELRLS